VPATGPTGTFYSGAGGPWSATPRDLAGQWLCAGLTAHPHFPSVSGAARFGRSCREPGRLRGGSSAWRAGWTGSPGARGRSGGGSRRAAYRPGRARRPGWWSCPSRTYLSAANRADDISPSCSWRQGRVYFLTLLEPLARQPVSGPYARLASSRIRGNGGRLSLTPRIG
jgi:hypothetical protein